MNKSHGFLFGFAVIAIAAMSTLAGCDNGSTDTAPNVEDAVKTYTGIANGKTYVLKITNSTTYELTVGEKTSSGTAVQSGSAFTLIPAGATVTFTVTVNGSGITGMDGTITYSGGSTEDVSGLTWTAPPEPPGNGGTTLDVPANLSAVTSTVNSITLNWGAVSGATKYCIERGTASSGPFTEIASVAATSYANNNLERASTFYYRIRAYAAHNSDIYSGYTAVVNASTAAVMGTAGLYKGTTPAMVTKIGNHTLEQALVYITTDAAPGDNYYIVLLGDTNCSPKTLGYSGKTVGITLMADGFEEKKIQLTSTGSLFTINSGVTLTIEANVTLVGVTDNTASLVTINSATGALKLNGGKISDNDSTAVNGGGGIAASGNCMFIKSATGGVITGYADDLETGNKVMNNGVIRTNRGHAVYAGSNMRHLEKTVPANKALDSRVSGASGGWTE